MKRLVFLSAIMSCMAFFKLHAQPNSHVNLHQTASTKFIDVNGTRYAYRVFGNKVGIPLIFLQHFTGTMDNWDPEVTNGFAKSFQVVLFDNKGIGASAGQTPDNIETMATDAISFIKALGYKKVNLLGFSMGGFVAQQITIDDPALVNRLILAGTGPKGGQGMTEIVKPLTESASLNPDEQKLFLFYTSTEASRALGRQSLSRIHQRTINRDPETGMPAIQAQLKSILAWAQPDAAVTERLKQIKLPVLVVNGSDDKMVPTVNSYLMYQNLPDARLSLYPDSGHGSIFQFPDLFLNEAIPFLKAK